MVQRQRAGIAGRDPAALAVDPAAGGYSESDVAGFLGENLLRVFEEGWGS